MKNAVLVLIALSALAACNTVEGVGRDLSSAARGAKEAIPESN